MKKRLSTTLNNIIFKFLNRNLYENIMLCNTFNNGTKFVKIDSLKIMTLKKKKF